MKPQTRVRFEGAPDAFAVHRWGEDPASPFRRWWFEVHAPEGTAAAIFLERLASGRYVTAYTATDKVLGTVCCTALFARDGVAQALIAGVGEPRK